MLFKMYKAALTAALASVVFLTGIALAHADATQRASESTHEVPEWMNRVCPTEDSVNCWYDGGHAGHTGPVFIRRIPGQAGMVCVLYADHPRRDYCERGVAATWGRGR